MASIIANRVKELRKSKGFSQEELAEKSGLNTRTIQRIENGSNEPRGDSLSRLASVLGVSPDSLFDFTYKEDKGFILLMHLSSLSFIFFPLLGLIVPLLLWFSKRDVVKHAKTVGQKIVNFQLTWFLLFIVVYVTTMILSFAFIGDSKKEYPYPIDSQFIIRHLVNIIGFYTLNVLITLFNFVRNLWKVGYTFYPAIPFLRK